MTAVGSDVAFNTAQQWLQTCLQDHPSCLRRELPFLPTRVIDVGTERHDDEVVKLYISKRTDHHDYAALSYCWGGPQSIRLTTANFNSMTHEILVDPLPQTIKDAIRVTRRLGIRFLWIDALCIIQEGDDSDKLREVGIMGAIFKNAILTITAASARGVSDGFLETRPGPTSVPLPFDSGSTGKIGTVRLVRTQNLTHNPMEPLNQRGWTLQEAFLSRRMLIYGEEEMVWHCHVENSKQTAGSLFHCVEDPSLSKAKAFDANIPLTSQKHQIWTILVEQYTRRGLSVQEDRLAAITGVIVELKPIFQDDCSFGTWHQNFSRQLAWYCNYSWCKVKESSKLSCAPSWSWASRSSQTRFVPEFQPSDENFWTINSNNALELIGKLRSAKEVRKRERRSWDIAWDSKLLEEDRGFDRFVEEYEGREVFCFLLGWGPSPGSAASKTCSLVLIRHIEEPGVYQRVGLGFSKYNTTLYKSEEVQTVILA